MPVPIHMSLNGNSALQDAPLPIILFVGKVVSHAIVPYHLKPLVIVTILLNSRPSRINRITQHAILACWVIVIIGCNSAHSDASLKSEFSKVLKLGNAETMDLASWIDRIEFVQLDHNRMLVKADPLRIKMIDDEHLGYLLCRTAGDCHL